MSLCEILIIIFFLLVIAGAYVFIIIDHVLTKKEMKPLYDALDDGHLMIEKMKILLEDQPIDKIDIIIDTNIQNAADHYMDLTFMYRKPDDIYITEDMEKEMSEYIFQSVKKDITKPVFELLSLIHCLNTEDDIDELLRFRIKLFMISLLVKTNK